MPETSKVPWYADKNQDAIFYLLIAIFFIELIIGGVSFFYGIMRAAPEVPGGPPVARFPWLVWAISSILSPVALLLIIHLAGSWLSSALTREEKQNTASDTGNDQDLPEGMRRFYASVRHAPTFVLLLAVLLLGASLFFIDGAIDALGKFGMALLPYLPWIACSLGSLLAVCFIAHCIMVYRQRKMENEYAWRREVLEKTGLVLTDKNSLPLPMTNKNNIAITEGNDQPLLPPGQTVIEASSVQKDEDQKDTRD